VDVPATEQSHRVEWSAGGGVFVRPLGGAPDTKMDPYDIAVLREIERWADEIVGYPMVSGFEEFTYEPEKPLHRASPRTRSPGASPRRAGVARPDPQAGALPTDLPEPRSVVLVALAEIVVRAHREQVLHRRRAHLERRGCDGRASRTPWSNRGQCNAAPSSGQPRPAFPTASRACRRARRPDLQVQESGRASASRGHLLRGTGSPSPGWRPDGAERSTAALLSDMLGPSGRRAPRGGGR
jgi:hypothetical protein